MGRNKKKVHSAQERLYQYHKANQKILSKHSIKELKVLALEYRKQEKTSKIIFTGKQHKISRMLGICIRSISIMISKSIN